MSFQSCTKELTELQRDEQLVPKLPLHQSQKQESDKGNSVEDLARRNNGYKLLLLLCSEG